MGRLTADPELRSTQTGVAVTTVTLACERDIKGQDGTRKTDFLDVTAWRGTAEFLCRYFRKGRMAAVSGRLQTREWTDKEGNRRRGVEIVADTIYFADSRRDGDNGGRMETEEPLPFD